MNNAFEKYDFQVLEPRVFLLKQIRRHSIFRVDLLMADEDNKGQVYPVSAAMEDIYLPTHLYEQDMTQVQF